MLNINELTASQNHNIYKEYRNKLTPIKEKAKAMYYQTLLGNCGNVSVTWKTIKNILNKNGCKDNSIPNQLNIIHLAMPQLSNASTQLAMPLASAMSLIDSSAILEKKWLRKPLS